MTSKREHREADNSNTDGLQIPEYNTQALDINCVIHLNGTTGYLIIIIIIIIIVLYNF